MSGILDNKTRVFDIVITDEGRRNLSERGSLDVEYFSFSDLGTQYVADVTSGSKDITNNVYLEQCCLPHDSLTFRANEAGNIETYPNFPATISDGRILLYTFSSSVSADYSGSNAFMQSISGEDLLNSGSALVSMVDGFRKHMTILSRDEVYDEGFSLSPQNIEFVITDSFPIKDRSDWVLDLNNVDSLYEDPRFSNSLNFKFLPPVSSKRVKNIDKSDPTKLAKFAIGDYRPWSHYNVKPVTSKQLEFEFSTLTKFGLCKKILFDPTTVKNNVMCQFFEFSSDQIKKLEIVDFGFYVSNGKNKRVFFVGKLVQDQKGTHTFLHLFSVVFE